VDPCSKTFESLTSKRSEDGAVISAAGGRKKNEGGVCGASFFSIVSRASHRASNLRACNEHRCCMHGEANVYVEYASTIVTSQDFNPWGR
jgi:hypothetical protein